MEIKTHTMDSFAPPLNPAVADMNVRATVTEELGRQLEGRVANPDAPNEAGKKLAIAEVEVSRTSDFVIVGLLLFVVYVIYHGTTLP